MKRKSVTFVMQAPVDKSVLQQLVVADLVKAETEDDDGVLTPLGFDLVTAYAGRWLQGMRDLDAERQHPELAGLFYDVRSDSELAHRYGD